MTAPTIYRSTDASAPVLTGAVGDLVNLLDKCLVAGYGSKTAAGWTKPYTGTGTAVFRMGAGNQFYLDVNDNGPGAGTFRDARLRGYEAMTAVATGTGAFPTAAQLANGVFARKSATADATARAWIVIADDRTVYVFMLAGDAAGTYTAFMFGDFYSVLTGDGYRTHIEGRTVENSALQTVETFALGHTGTLSNTPTGGCYMPRAYTGTGTSQQAIKLANSDFAVLSSATTPIGVGTVPFPNGPDGGYYMARISLLDPTTFARRGWLRGIWNWGHPAASAIADGDTLTGSGDLAGRTFLFLKTVGNGAIVVETSNTWDTST